jgi:DNA-binding MarR family transcriptional regulator
MNNERVSSIPSERSRDKNVLVDVWLIANLATQLVGDDLAGTPLSTDEFALYGLIVDLGPLTAADLSRATGLPPTTLSGILGRCQQRGELVRAPNPADRRSALLQLTPAGLAIYHRLVPKLLDLLNRLDAALDAPPAELRLHLQALDGALRAVRGAGPRPYRVDSPPARPLTYRGERLSPRQQREVLGYIDWIRHRDGAAPADPADPAGPAGPAGPD